MRAVFRPPTPADLDALAASMRPMDVKECAIVSGQEPRAALDTCVESAAWCLVMEVGGEVACLFGVTDEGFLSDEGQPWMLCAEGMERHARIVLTLTPRFFAHMKEGRERLYNIVHAHNRSAIRYLRWCGFTFGEEFTLRGEPFLPFEWRRA